MNSMAVPSQPETATFASSRVGLGSTLVVGGAMLSVISCSFAGDEKGRVERWRFKAAALRE
jgi:hypothetical protein